MRWLIRRAICALYPGSERLPPVAALDLDAFIERVRRESSPLFWTGVLLGALVFTLSPILTIGVPLPSVWLGKEALDRHADRVTSHRWYLIRQPVFLVKMVGGLAWGQHAKVRALNNLPAYPPDPGTWRS